MTAESRKSVSRELLVPGVLESAAACFVCRPFWSLHVWVISPIMGKTADRNTIINSHAGGQTVNSTIEYH